MRTTTEPFRFSHLEELRAQPRHREVARLIRNHPVLLHPFMVGPWSWTVRDPGGRPVACCGIAELNDHTWAVLGERVGHSMVPLTRWTRHVLGEYLRATRRRPLADIDEDHSEALRWAAVLGFRRLEPGLWEYHARVS